MHLSMHEAMLVRQLLRQDLLQIEKDLSLTMDQVGPRTRELLIERQQLIQTLLPKIGREI